MPWTALSSSAERSTAAAVTDFAEVGGAHTLGFDGGSGGFGRPAGFSVGKNDTYDSAPLEMFGFAGVCGAQTLGFDRRSGGFGRPTGSAVVINDTYDAAPPEILQKYIVHSFT